MSEEEVEEEFSDTAGEEGDPPAAEWGVPPLDAWIVELVAKVGASRKLSEADQLRLPTALQLQNQHAIAVQQAKAEAAAQKVAEQQSARDSEILKQLSAVKEESSSKIAALEAELAAVKRGKEEDVEPQFREFVERDAKNPFGGPGTVRGGDDLEPRLRAYPDEVAYKWIESKGGKDFFNFQALESAAEVLFRIRQRSASQAVPAGASSRFSMSWNSGTSTATAGPGPIGHGSGASGTGTRGGTAAIALRLCHRSNGRARRGVQLERSAAPRGSRGRRHTRSRELRGHGGAADPASEAVHVGGRRAQASLGDGTQEAAQCTDKPSSALGPGLAAPVRPRPQVRDGAQPREHSTGPAASTGRGRGDAEAGRAREQAHPQPHGGA